MSLPRKILIATPIKLGLTSTYMAGFSPTIQTPFPGIVLEHCTLDGTSVNFARNEIAHYAIAIGASEIVFIDDDMGWDRSMFERLISHTDLDVVAGLYCKRVPGKPVWVKNDLPGAVTDPVTGLCEVESAATGWMKIKTSVFKTIAEKMPHLEYFNKPHEGKEVTAFEFFPMGVIGPRTAEARMVAVQTAIQEVVTIGHDAITKEQLWQTFNKMTAALCQKQPAGNLHGEDYYFCHLARKCGFKIYMDYGGQIIPHVGKARFPITPDMVGLHIAPPAPPSV